MCQTLIEVLNTNHLSNPQGATKKARPFLFQMMFAMPSRNFYETPKP
jgi:hypothetical protein